jgi:hypothetical protein
VEIDEFCHGKGIYFIAADVRGLFGSVLWYSREKSIADALIAPYSTTLEGTSLV